MNKQENGCQRKTDYKMNQIKDYKKTKLACYLGFVTQAIVANFTPLLFIAFHREYGIPIASLALIPAVFYVVQLVTDFLCAKFKNIDYRKSIIVSEVTAALGLAGLAFVPALFSNPLVGILICVCVYAVGSGLIEVLCSPIIEACPFPNKESMMSLLHSFYCWGAVGVIVGSTLFFTLFGLDNWRILACLWALIPLYNIINFATCPIEPIVENSEGMSMSQLLGRRMFWLFLLLMVAAGASESSMAQWTSAFAEASLGVDKAWATLVWEERSAARPVSLYESCWRSVLCCLSDRILVVCSAHQLCGLHDEWPGCGYHVAWLHQPNFGTDAYWWHCTFCTARTGWRCGWNIGTIPCGTLYQIQRERHPERSACSIGFSCAAGGVSALPS